MTTPLSEHAKDNLINLYEERYQKLGASVKSLGWKDEESQCLRFRALCAIGDLSNSSICDVGCGFGDLITYLNQQFTNIQYHGIDVCAPFINEARNRFPAYSFSLANLFDDSFDYTCDYFILSGALTFHVDDNWKLVTTALEKMMRLARKGVAVNFLTSYVDFQEARNAHYNPAELFAFARTLTHWVSLRHDYPLWEFTLHLYKEPQLYAPPHVTPSLPTKE
jgi:SAM-dependent methyltransferase